MPQVDRSAVYAALDDVPDVVWFCAISAMRGVVNVMGNTLMDDDGPERAVVEAIDAALRAKGISP